MEEVSITIEDKASTNSFVNNGHPPSDYKKLFFSVLYLMFAYALSAYVTVIVHEKISLANNINQLPDLALNNITYRPWAIPLSEYILIFLSLCLTILIIFHKHRFIVIRRGAVILSTLMLIRCATLLVTSLPTIYAVYPRCHKRQPKLNNLSDRLYFAFIIFKGMGLSIHEIVTCGDFIFSGHTVNLVIVTLTLTEHMPSPCTILRWILKALCVFAILLILVGHNHYTIDVLIGFFIATQFHSYYYLMANNYKLRQNVRKYSNIWFPIVIFFEKNVKQTISNEYEWPFGNLENGKLGNCGSKTRTWFALNVPIQRYFG